VIKPEGLAESPNYGKRKVVIGRENKESKADINFPKGFDWLSKELTLISYHQG